MAQGHAIEALEILPVHRIWPVTAALVFVSGACALVYQMVWTRELRLVFGASTAASSAVIAIFIAGLGSGGLWWSKRLERRAVPLRDYARLELAIAATSALTPFLLHAVRGLYAASGGSPVLGPVGSTALRLVLSALVFGPTTWLMGGTLPAVARAIERDGDAPRRGVALAYGANTLGAVVGCAVATFVLLEKLGSRTTLWAACGLNILLACAAFWFARELSAHAEPEEAPRTAEVASLASEPPVASAVLVSAAAAIVGFAFFLMELVWYRMLAPLLGGTVHTFGLILAVALAGVGLGSALYAASMRERRASVLGLALSCSAEGLCIALPYALGDRVAVWAALLRPLRSLGFAGLAFSWLVIATCVVLPAALVSGFQFPLLIALLGRGRRNVARDVGRAYAANTAGCVAGALAGGFGLLSTYGALGCWKLASLLLVALGLGLGLSELVRHRRLRVGFAVAATAMLALSCLVAARGPTALFRHSPIGAGRVPIASIDTANELVRFVHEQRRDILWEQDGVESTIGLSRTEGLSFIVNGKSDGNARADAGTQVMGALLGAALRPAIKRAFVIGLGTGSTTGWLAALPELERVDVAELEPAIVSVARECSAVNRGALDNPKHRVHFGDARELLTVSREQYQLIASEPSNPYRAGIASLYTSEFYGAVRRRLAPSGIFVQWLQAYDVDPALVCSIYATMGATFAHVETWSGQGTDLLLVASQTPLVHDAQGLRERLGREPFRTAMRLAWQSEGLEGFLGHYVANERFTKACSDSTHGRQNTDDHSYAEFGFARGVRLNASLVAQTLLESARRRGDHRPTLIHSESVAWERVDFERAAFRLLDGDAYPTSTNYLAPVYRERLTVLGDWVRGDFAAALRGWNQHATRDDKLIPTRIERIALGELIAYQGDAGSELWLDRVLDDEPTLAATMHAVWSAKHGELTRSTEQLEHALALYRTDPWPIPAVMERALLQLSTAHAQDAVRTRRMLAALSRPFAVHVNDAARERALVTLSSALGPTEPSCVHVLSTLEPDVPWDESLLEFRVRCYAAQQHPLRARAELDLQQFRRETPASFDRLLSEPRRGDL